VDLTLPDPAIVPVYVSAAEPQAPIIEGSLWFNTVTFELSVWLQEDGLYVWRPAVGNPPEQPFVYVSVAPPTNPVEGTLWYKPSTYTLSIWVTSGVNSEWRVISSQEPSPANSSTVLVSTSPPTNPTQGLLWFNPINNSLKAWVETLSGSSWRPITGSSSSPKPTVSVSSSPPTNPVQGDLWWKPSSQELKVWNVALSGSNWSLISDNTPQPGQPPVYVSIDEPVNPKSRYLWFNPQNKELKVFENQEWELVSTSEEPVLPPVKISVSPPPDAKVGDLWFDTNTGFFNLKLGEGSTQWISPTQGPPGPPGPPGPIATRLDQLVDVNVVNRVDQSLLYYDSQSSIFKADSTTTSFTLTDGGNF
jgi:hypothetical protein